MQAFFGTGTIVLALVVSSMAADEGAGPETVAKRFYRLANSGKCADAKALFTSEAISVVDHTLGQDGFAQFCSGKAGRAPLTSLEVQAEQEGAGRATVSIMRKYGNGDLEMESDTLVRTGSSWKITLGESQVAKATSR